MAQERFIEVGTGTFYGEYVYDQVVPKDHFFRKLNEMLDWRKYTQKMMRWYKGRAEYGRPPFDPAILLKMLLVAYLYNLSERQVEEYRIYIPEKHQNGWVYFTFCLFFQHPLRLPDIQINISISLL